MAKKTNYCTTTTKQQTTIIQTINSTNLKLDTLITLVSPLKTRSEPFNLFLQSTFVSGIVQKLKHP